MEILIYILLGLAIIVAIPIICYLASRGQMRGWIKEIELHFKDKYNNLNLKEDYDKDKE
jgi:hypothetical protein